jgi:phosphatidate cytidylyltransferase
MRQRLIGSAVLVPVVVIVFLAGQPWLTLGIAVLAALAAWETVSLVRQAGLPASRWLPVLWAPLAVLVFAESVEPSFELSLTFIAPGLAVLVILAAILAFTHRDPADGFRAWLGTTFSGVYPGMLAFLAAFIGLSAKFQTGSFFGYHLDDGRIFLLILVLTVWTLDSAAYLAGKYHGRGRFMNHISPKKTWSGAIGGTVAAVLVCTVLVAGAGWGPVYGAVLGLVIAIAAQAGDLAESMLKRAAGAKDSGTLIPGHGGILDRVDSFIFAGPALYTALWVIAGLSATQLL